MWSIRKFKTRAEMLAWVTRNAARVQWHEVFVNNAYAVEFRPLRIIG